MATWRGFVYVAFVIDAFSCRIVGWCAYRTMKANLVLDALEQALPDRETDDGPRVRLEGGSQYVSMRYTGRSPTDGVAPSVGSVGDAYDNALAERVSKELCVCDLATLPGLSQPTVSHSLRALRQLGLVRYRRDGRIAYYALDDAHVVQVLDSGLAHAAEAQSAT